MSSLHSHSSATLALSMRTASEMPANGLELCAIDPARDARFSPNLFKFLKKRRHLASVAQVYRDRDGVLWLGFEDSPFFVGVRLMEILCQGTKAQTGAYPNFWPLDRVENFWPEYLKSGRCAVDPKHKEHFRGGLRWESRGEALVCRWCGATAGEGAASHIS